ncbi:MAG: GIY-YIG nuclease family protein [Patescibacteria group bacterium]
MYNVYAIHNKKNEKIYIGQTSDIESRLARHNGVLKNKKGSFTKINSGPWKLVYRESFLSRKEAVIRERQLKSYRGREYIRKVLHGSKQLPR